MKLDDPQSGRQVSFEQRFPTKEACKRAIDSFAQEHPGARYYNLTKGGSFQIGKAGEIEQRFTYPGSTRIIYYEAMENGEPVKNFGQFQRLYNKYLAAGYQGRRNVHEDGGRDGHGGRTARCLLESDKVLWGEEFGLLINPPFPHGTPGSDKNHEHGPKGRKANSYLLVLAGLVAGLAFSPIRKALRKRWSHTGR